MRLDSRLVVALISLGVGGYAIVAYSLLPIGAAVHPELRASFEAHRFGVYAHVFGAAIALLLGPLQFSRLRVSRPNVHRLIGRLYLGVGVGIGGISGLYLSFFAYGVSVSQAGFGLLALAWLYTGLRAYVCARAKQFVEHRRWMIRNFALAFAAVTLRVYLGLAMGSGLAFELIYPLLAWVSWVPNAIVAERLARRAA